MTINLVFVLLILGHVLGDFYFQTDKMVEDKEGYSKALIAHGIEYMLCMGVILFAGIEKAQSLFSMWLSTGVIHWIIDACKKSMASVSWMKKRLFVLDQLLHFATLVIVWRIWGIDLKVQWFVQQDMTHLPAKPVLIILGLLCILRPVGLLIEKGEIWDFSKNKPQEKTTKNAGKMIGYLERAIVFFFLLYHQYSAIAFVLTAKSVARFKEIEQDQSKAEYYLIGTLMSMVFVLFITLLLGLC